MKKSIISLALCTLASMPFACVAKFNPKQEMRNPQRTQQLQIGLREFLRVQPELQQQLQQQVQSLQTMYRLQIQANAPIVGDPQQMLQVRQQIQLQIDRGRQTLQQIGQDIQMTQQEVYNIQRALAALF